MAKIKKEHEPYAVVMEDVSKIYRLKKKARKNVKGSDEHFYALHNINFKIEKGDCVGILGTNGSGKSTLSLILSGISDKDSGSILVNGEQALIAINTGLNMQLTGEENIELKGALLGLKKKEIENIKQSVIEFAELGDFLYQPVKKYSSGMKSRLGFSISLALDPDIFIVDEALSVGDKGFAQKCMTRMQKLRDEEGKTIFFISHALQQVRDFCHTGMWIEGGKLVEIGDIDTVCDHYSTYVDEYNALSEADKKKQREEKFQERIIQNYKKKLFW
ncbi:ABC transporter ATP-binding protein [Amedibacillus sp. YH-ame10]